MSANPIYAELDAINDKLTQAIASQEIDSLEAARSAVGKSFDYIDARKDRASLYMDRALHHLERAMDAIDEHFEEGNDMPREQETKEALAAFVRANKPVEHTR